MRIAFAGFAVLLLCAGFHTKQAHAESQEAREAKGGTSIAYNHAGQFGIYAQFGIAYRAIFRYNANDYCGSAGEGACTAFGQPYVELGLSFAPTKRIELLTELRLGLGDDFHPDTVTRNLPRELSFAPGIKVYLDDFGSLKWFGTLQVALDFTDYSADGVKTGLDVGIKNVNGLLVDLHHTFGVYGFVGETVSFVRWFRFDLNFGVGMQARFP